MFNKVQQTISGLALLLTSLSICSYAQNFSEVEISVTKVKEHIYLLQGQGGNIGVLASEDGLVMIDNQFKPLAEKIETAMHDIVDKPIKYIINTHYHGDHTGGNEVFGHHSPIFAHENVRKRLATKAPQSVALPVVTYQNGVNIHFANHTIDLVHLPNGHTDGDTYVYFREANVLHTGDLFFNGLFPFIDLNGGGSVEGYLANVEAIINKMPDDVIIIPGHGQLTDLKGYQAFAEMLRYSIEKAKTAIAAGQSEAEFIAGGIGKKYQHLAWAFISEEKWLKTMYQGLLK